MIASSFDQKAWLDRIGYDGPLEPTLSALNQLIFAHAHTIAYESLDIMLGRTPKLDLETLQRKMILGGRGGYCLEQNMLFREGLRSLGYQITSLQGRVVRGMAIDAPRPAIHMLLEVDLPEGPYLADVGFGNLAPTQALLMREGVEQETPHEPMRFIDVGGELTLQAKLRDTWEHIYRVIPYPRYDGDFMASHVNAKRKARTAEGYSCIIELHIKPTIGRIRVDGLTQTHISRLHGSLASTPYQANRVLAVLSKMLGWAEQHGYRQRGTNPCRDIDRFMEARRERFLSTEELARLGKALFDMETEGSESLFATAAVQLLLFTGARLSEVLTLRWEWVDLQRGLLLLPTSKTGRKTIRLNASAAEILTSVPRVENNPYVVVGHREGQHLVNLSKAWRRILIRAELHGVRLHDLRHTFASTGAAVSGSLPMIGKLMGHTNVATTARYAHLTVDPVQLLNEEIGRTMAAALGRQMREATKTPDRVES